MGGAHRLAFAAAQAVLDRVGDLADRRLLHDEGFLLQQAEAGRIGVAQVGAGHQLALVEVAIRVDPLLVLGKGRDGLVVKVFQLGEPNAVFAGNHAAQIGGQAHDARHGSVGFLQHAVIVGIDRDVGMHVAVAGMHVQGNEHAALEHGFVDFIQPVENLMVLAAGKNLVQRFAHFTLPGHPQVVLLHRTEHRRQLAHAGLRHQFHSPLAEFAQRRIEAIQHLVPVRTGVLDQRQGLLAAGFDPLRVGLSIFVLHQRQFAVQKALQRIEQFQLVADGQLDVDALDAVGVIPQARQRNDHILVDLEGIGMLRDGCGAGTVQPEFLARIGADGNEAFASACVGQAHDMRCRFADGVLVIAGDVGYQYHLGTLRTVGLGGVTDGFQVALVQMLQACQQRVRMGVQVILDFDDGRHRQCHRAEKFQADGAYVRRHPMQDESGRSDQAVAAFLLDAGQAGQEFVRHILAEAGFAEMAARNFQDFRFALTGLAVFPVAGNLEARQLDIVNLAQVVVEALHLDPAPLRIDHAPGHEVVDRCAPEHRLLAPGVHRHIAAHAGGVGRGRIDCEHQSGSLRRVCHALRHHTRRRLDGGHRMRHPGQFQILHRADPVEFFGVDHRTLPHQRHRTAGIASATSARNDGEAQFDAALHQAGNLGLGVRTQHDKGVFHPPVGRIGDMADTRHAVEADAALRAMPAQHLARALAQRGGLVEPCGECGHGVVRAIEQLAYKSIPLRICAIAVRTVVAPAVDFPQAVTQGADQRVAPLAALQQIVLQERIALHHPDVAQHLVQHARRATGTAFLSQLVEPAPRLCAKQAHDHFAVGKRRVVVGDLAQTRRRICRRRAKN
ncbi:hypothetical protein GALL_398520 [mine drainage metagenome]|uniref:Uncharacterized protein n=1 Tax=mine drainage metagenome TaxID=410659 RepID=A0A1J5Q404_9ZZZZ